MKKQNTLINYPKRVDIIGVPISAVNMNKSLNFIFDNLESVRGEYICASNVHTTVMAYENEDYLRVQSESLMSLPDGKPLSVIGRKKGYKNMDKVTGTNFMKNIFNDKRFADKKHYFYGVSEERLELMIKEVNKNYPNLNICGYEPSIFRELSESEINNLIKSINDSNADFIWIGIGAPRQEILMNRLKGKVNGIMIGVGGAFNILAGVVNDAPIWMQNTGLDWFYRFLKEPKRLFKRYLITNSKFIFYNWRKR
ncbi:WecB/TagA/CpsF family glycosyltransferase [Clostridium perfringens]|nr:WecB/TagA/CpsF family glycosyltransferase [Clostridium perfringens]